MSLEAHAKKRFLIVDELDNFRFATKNALMSLGLKLVDTADSASKVLSSVKNVDYDVILCNFELGKGKNGQELLEELRYRKLLKFGSLFLIVTGEVAKDKVMGTIENEPDGYLVKPVTPAELKTRLKKMLDAKDELKNINAAIDEGNYKKALDACDEKLASGTRYKLACLKTKAWLLTKLGEVEVAKQLYRSILEKQQANWAEFALARLCIEDEEFDAAEKLLNDILDREENRVEALDLLANIYEATGQSNKARATLESALAKSPNSLLRQKHYADLCVESGHTDQAVDAFRKVIKLGDQSIYAKPDQYFEFAEQLTQHYKDDESANGRKHVKEAFDLLGKAKKRFSDDNQIDLQVQYSEASLRYGMGDQEAAESILSSLDEKIEKKQLSLSANSARFAAKAFIKAGRNDEAEKLLEEAADNAQGDDDAIKEIYDLLKSQISSEDRQKAAGLNKIGIKEYNEGHIDKAVEELEKATAFTPRHISLNLNLIQVLIKRIKKTDPKNPQYHQDYQKCTLRFRYVRHVPHHHREYKRLQYLKKQYKDLKK